MVEIETGLRAPARNRKSHFINQKPAANIHHAIRLAEQLGKPLHTFVSINFTLTATPMPDMVAAFERLRDNFFCPWFRRCARSPQSDGPAMYVWAAENANGCHGIHWLVHIPKYRLKQFAEMMEYWLEEVAGPYSEGALHIKFAKTPRSAGKYMLKGTDPHYAPFYGVISVPQGEIIGKRSGFSRSLGPSVRLRLAAKRGTRHWQRDDDETCAPDDTKFDGTP